MSSSRPCAGQTCRAGCRRPGRGWPPCSRPPASRWGRRCRRVLLSVRPREQRPGSQCFCRFRPDRVRLRVCGSVSEEKPRAIAYARPCSGANCATPMSAEELPRLESVAAVLTSSPLRYASANSMRARRSARTLSMYTPVRASASMCSAILLGSLQKSGRCSRHKPRYLTASGSKTARSSHRSSTCTNGTCKRSHCPKQRSLVSGSAPCVEEAPPKRDARGPPQLPYAPAWKSGCKPLEAGRLVRGWCLHAARL